VVETHRSRNQQGLSRHDRAVEKWLPRPDALQDTTVVAKNGVENPKPAPRGKHPFGHDSSHTSDFLPYLCPGERRNRGCVYIAVGEVPEEVSSCPYAEPFERFGSTLSNALQELDRRVQPDDGGGAGRHPGLGGLYC
jgi:hypothetical protein